MPAGCPRYCALPSPRKRAIFEFVTGVTGVTGAQICRRLIIYTKKISTGTCMFPIGYACIHSPIYIYIYMLIAGLIFATAIFVCGLGAARCEYSKGRRGHVLCAHAKRSMG